MANITQRVIRRARKEYGVPVLSRRQWGSRLGSVYRRRRSLTASGQWGAFRLKADTVAQHITVTRPTGNFKADCQAVERIGQSRFGSGVSYNWLVNMATGEVAEGQPLDSKGTHTVNDKGRSGYSRNQNLVARAIAVIGMPDSNLSRDARESIAGLLAAMIDEGAITEDFDYQPHSFFAWKDCPCDATRNAMPSIYDRAHELRKSANRKPVPNSRGKAVDSALDSIDTALGRTKGTARTERLSAAKSWLEQIKVRFFRKTK